MGEGKDSIAVKLLSDSSSSQWAISAVPSITGFLPRLLVFFWGSFCSLGWFFPPVFSSDVYYTWWNTICDLAQDKSVCKLEWVWALLSPRPFNNFWTSNPIRLDHDSYKYSPLVTGCWDWCFRWSSNCSWSLADCQFNFLSCYKPPSWPSIASSAHTHNVCTFFVFILDVLNA